MAKIKQFVGVSGTMRKPKSKYGAVMYQTDPATGKSVPVIGIPQLLTCCNTKCAKQEQKPGQFQRCTRCHLSFCSRDCQVADHKIETNKAQCKAYGKRLERYKTHFAKCDAGCGAKFAEHLKKGRIPDDFDPCMKCMIRYSEPGCVRPEDGKINTIATREELLKEL